LELQMLQKMVQIIIPKFLCFQFCHILFSHLTHTAHTVIFSLISLSCWKHVVTTVLLNLCNILASFICIVPLQPLDFGKLLPHVHIPWFITISHQDSFAYGSPWCWAAWTNSLVFFSPFLVSSVLSLVSVYLFFFTMAWYYWFR
jgi:hypothetical protein